MRLRLLTVWLLFGVLLSACTPKYPKCNKDAHCQTDGRKEWCVNNQCQQCRPGMTDCGPGKECKAGRCEAIPGYCDSDVDCPTRRCVNNRCVNCQSDGQCGAGSRCKKGVCSKEDRKACKSHDDCAESEDCIDGYCTPANSGDASQQYKAICDVETVYFDFNESVLSAEATGIIDRNADCIKRTKRPLSLVGHTDPRGTPEYNLALAERRAQSVKNRLLRLGVAPKWLYTLPRGELDASGTDETGWSRDRRVEFQWR